MDNSVTLLRDEHAGMMNPWNKPVVGWQPNADGVSGLHNPLGFAFVRVVQQNGDGQALYDQPVIIENAGAVVLPVLGDRIGLIRVWRANAARLMDVGAAYVRQLQDENRWAELIDTLGSWNWEAPRGLSPEGVAGEALTEHVIRTAKLEAKEEAGFEIANARLVGKVNANTTFFAHPQYVVRADVESIGDKSPEDLEQGVIGQTKFFTMVELAELNRNGEFVCGLTLSALALCGLALPL